MWKNAFKMWRMQKLVNYVYPHHRILSDALYTIVHQLITIQDFQYTIAIF